jgi:polyisoprenoid-binding protein YceI
LPSFIFTVTKWGFVEVEGRFLDFAGAIQYDPAHVDQSHLEWRVRVASVQTGELKRDQALQAPEYFDAAQFPELTFVSDRVVATGPSQFDVSGRITIRGKTAPLTTHVVFGGTHTVPGEGIFDIFTTAFTLNRYDFGVAGGSVLGLAISRDVQISLTAATNYR